MRRARASVLRLASASRFAYLLIGLLCLTGCSQPGMQEDSWSVKRGEPVPQFKLTATDGKEYSNADLKDKVSLIAIWATWCPPCRMELPVLDSKIYQPLKAKGVQVLGVNAAEETSAVQEFAKQSGLTFPLLADLTGSFSAAVGGDFLPRSLLIDRKGIIRNLHAGFDPQSADELVKEVEKLAAEK